MQFLDLVTEHPLLAAAALVATIGIIVGLAAAFGAFSSGAKATITLRATIPPAAPAALRGMHIRRAEASEAPVATQQLTLEAMAALGGPVITLLGSLSLTGTVTSATYEPETSELVLGVSVPKKQLAAAQEQVETNVEQVAQALNDGIESLQQAVADGNVDGGGALETVVSDPGFDVEKVVLTQATVTAGKEVYDPATADAINPAVTLELKAELQGGDGWTEAHLQLLAMDMEVKAIDIMHQADPNPCLVRISFEQRMLTLRVTSLTKAQHTARLASLDALGGASVMFSMDPNYSLLRSVPCRFDDGTGSRAPLFLYEAVATAYRDGFNLAGTVEEETDAVKLGRKKVLPSHDWTSVYPWKIAGNYDTVTAASDVENMRASYVEYSELEAARLVTADAVTFDAVLVPKLANYKGAGNSGTLPHGFYKTQAETFPHGLFSIMQSTLDVQKALQGVELVEATRDLSLKTYGVYPVVPHLYKFTFVPGTTLVQAQALAADFANVYHDVTEPMKILPPSAASTGTAGTTGTKMWAQVMGTVVTALKEAEQSTLKSVAAYTFNVNVADVTVGVEADAADAANTYVWVRVAGLVEGDATVAQQEAMWNRAHSLITTMDPTKPVSTVRALPQMGRGTQLLLCGIGASQPGERTFVSEISTVFKFSSSKVTGDDDVRENADLIADSMIGGWTVVLSAAAGRHVVVKDVTTATSATDGALVTATAKVYAQPDVRATLLNGGESVDAQSLSALKQLANVLPVAQTVNKADGTAGTESIVCWTSAEGAAAWGRFHGHIEAPVTRTYTESIVNGESYERPVYSFNAAYLDPTSPLSVLPRSEYTSITDHWLPNASRQVQFLAKSDTNVAELYNVSAAQMEGTIKAAVTAYLRSMKTTFADFPDVTDNDVKVETTAAAGTLFNINALVAVNVLDRVDLSATETASLQKHLNDMSSLPVPVYVPATVTDPAKLKWPDAAAADNWIAATGSDETASTAFETLAPGNMQFMPAAVNGLDISTTGTATSINVPLMYWNSIGAGEWQLPWDFEPDGTTRWENPTIISRPEWDPPLRQFKQRLANSAVVAIQTYYSRLRTNVGPSGQGDVTLGQFGVIVGDVMRAGEMEGYEMQLVPPAGFTDFDTQFASVTRSTTLFAHFPYETELGTAANAGIKGTFNGTLPDATKTYIAWRPPHWLQSSPDATTTQTYKNEMVLPHSTEAGFDQAAAYAATTAKPVDTVTATTTDDAHITSTSMRVFEREPDRVFYTVSGTTKAVFRKYLFQEELANIRYDN